MRLRSTFSMLANNLRLRSQRLRRPCLFWSSSWLLSLSYCTKWKEGRPLATVDGTDCFVTGNGGGTSGTDDVDEGPTTLFTPVFDLSEVGAGLARAPEG